MKFVWYVCVCFIRFHYVSDVYSLLWGIKMQREPNNTHIHIIWLLLLFPHRIWNGARRKKKKKKKTRNKHFAKSRYREMAAWVSCLTWIATFTLHCESKLKLNRTNNRSSDGLNQLNSIASIRKYVQRVDVTVQTSISATIHCIYVFGYGSVLCISIWTRARTTLDRNTIHSNVQRVAKMKTRAHKK